MPLLFEYAGAERSVFFLQHDHDQFQKVLAQVLAELWKEQQAPPAPAAKTGPMQNE